MAFDQALLDKIRAAVDIAEVVGEYVPLKKAGASSLKGLCPFHKEKSPSFNVNTRMQIFKCFGCSAAGSVFTFLSRIENIPFPEAVRRLADRAKIPVADASPAATQEEQELLRIRQALETAAALYQKTLASPAGASAREYLASRKFTPEAIAKFRLGLCTGREVATAKMHPALLTRAGLASARDDGSLSDRMRGRLVIPITDERGRIIGFGGRAMLPDQQPKYLNTAETPLFHKSALLYALAEAKEAIRKSERIILVEGYFDAIALHASGIPETVASMGTSLTESQLGLLKRFARTLMIVYDEDMGGNEAALRGLDLATAAGFDVRIVRLPSGSDPDEYVLTHGRDAFLRLLDDAAGGSDATLSSAGSSAAPGGSALPLFEYRLELACRQADPVTLVGQKRIVASLLPFLARVPNAIERFAYIKRLAERVRAREQDIEEELRTYLQRQPSRPAFGGSRPAVPAPRAVAAPAGPSWRAERLLLTGALRQQTAGLGAIFELRATDWPSPAAAKLAARLHALLDAGESFSVASLMDEYQEDPGVLELLAGAEEGGDGERGSDAALTEAAAHLKRLATKSRLQDLQRRIERASDPAEASRLIAEKQSLAASA